MRGKVVDFSLENRLLVIGAALLLLAWGTVSFHQLPVEAYPDVANNYVEIITQWPGISAEQIEQQVTIPLEVVMNGIPHVVHLRSFSLFGLSQVEQQLTNNNANAGGSFIEAGLQQINIREVGLVRNVQDIANTVIMTKSGTPLRVKDIAAVAQGPKIRLGQFARAIHREDGKIIDNDDVVSGIVLLRKGANADEALAGIHAKVKELNDRILPPGVKLVSFIDRTDLVHFTTHTVLHNLTEGIILLVVVLFLFLGNATAALIVALTIPFSLLFAATCLRLNGIPANLLSLVACAC